MDTKEGWVRWGRRETEVRTGCRDCLGSKGSRESRDMMELQDLRASGDHQDLQGVGKANQALKVTQDQEVIQVLQGLRAWMVLTVHQEREVPRVNREGLAFPAHLDLKASQDQREPKENLVYLDSQEKMDLLDSKDHQG